MVFAVTRRFGDGVIRWISAFGKWLEKLGMRLQDGWFADAWHGSAGRRVWSVELFTPTAGIEASCCGFRRVLSDLFNWRLAELKAFMPHGYEDVLDIGSLDALQIHGGSGGHGGGTGLQNGRIQRYLDCVNDPRRRPSAASPSFAKTILFEGASLGGGRRMATTSQSRLDRLLTATEIVPPETGRSRRTWRPSAHQH